MQPRLLAGWVRCAGADAVSSGPAQMLLFSYCAGRQLCTPKMIVRAEPGHVVVPHRCGTGVRFARFNLQVVAYYVAAHLCDRRRPGLRHQCCTL